MRRAAGSRGGGIVLAAGALLLLTSCTRASASVAPDPSAAPRISTSASGGDSAIGASHSTAAPRTGTSAGSTTAATEQGFDLTAHSLDDPTSIWVVVDKRRPLQPRNWVPEDLVQPAVPHTNTPLLRKPAARALERLVAGAAREGVHVTSLSAYRAYTTQKSIYDHNVASMGKAATERLTARPGYSEHQTGLADDLGDGSGRCGIQTCFATTPAGRWLAANAWRYGFIQRYPKGQQAQTGIQWEPWHYRFIGTALARHLHRTGQTVLERAFGLPASPDYR